MKREEIKPGIMVRNTKTEKIGVLFTGHVYDRIDPRTEVPIIYQGDDSNPQITPHFELTSSEDLEKYQPQAKDLLTEQHMKNVCKPRTENACRYLIRGAFGYECAKVLDNFNIAEHIDVLVEEGNAKAKGNNCGGRYNIEVLQREEKLLS